MKLILTAIIVLNSAFCFAKGGDEVRNGGGIAESYLTFALANLHHSIANCLLQDECANDSTSRKILNQISSTLKLEQKKNILNFKTMKEMPGLFIIEGYVRMAVTGSRVGDPVYYNMDMLYKNNQSTINYGQAIQSLIHELGHHQGVMDHDQLERIGTEVRLAENRGAICRETSGFFCNETLDRKIEWMCQTCSSEAPPVNSHNTGEWFPAGKNCFHRELYFSCRESLTTGEFCNDNGKVVLWQCGIIDNPGQGWTPQGDGCFHQMTKNKCK